MDIEASSPSIHELAAAGDTARIRQLVEQQGVNVYTRDAAGNTALHASSLEGRNNTVQYLLSVHAKVNARNAHQITPLHYACARGNRTTIEMLLANGAFVNAKQDDHITALHHSARQGDPEVVRELLKHGVDIDAVSLLDGWTALHYAQERGNAQVVELLLKKGANPHVADPQGRVAGTESIYSFSIPLSVRAAISKMCHDLRQPPPSC